jgi:hypothetical protein
MQMQRDTLFLLEPHFADPAYPGQRFFCWHCALIEGVLSSFPELTSRLDVVRIAWPRPREAVVERIGVENQSLPVLLLADDAQGLEAERYGAQSFVAGKDAILNVLSLRHGIAVPHP